MQERTFKFCFIQVEIGNQPAFADAFDGIVNHIESFGLFTDLNHIVFLNDVGRNIDDFSVNREVAMGYHLPGGTPGRRESEPVNGVIHSAFEQLEQDFTGDAVHFGSSFVETVELFFEQSVAAADFLFFPQLESVFRDFHSAALSMLARREISSFTGAFRSEASFPFEEKFFAFSSTDFTLWSSITSHVYLP